MPTPAIWITVVSLAWLGLAVWATLPRPEAED